MIPGLVAGKLAASILDEEYLPGAQLPTECDLIKELEVGKSPYWADKPKEVLENIRVRTPIGRLITLNDVVDASAF